VRDARKIGFDSREGFGCRHAVTRLVFLVWLTCVRFVRAAVCKHEFAKLGLRRYGRFNEMSGEVDWRMASKRSKAGLSFDLVLVTKWVFT